MGAKLVDEDKAISCADQIPQECRKYISHHVRNGLISIMGLAAGVADPDTLEVFEEEIMHIAGDLEKVGL